MPTRSDIDAQFSVTRAIGPVSIATDTNTLSSAIDMTSKPGWRVLLVASVGTRTDGTYTFSIHESDASGGSYSAITPFSGSVAAVSAATTTRTAAYLPTKPFIKVNVLSASTTSGALVDAYVVLVPPAA